MAGYAILAGTNFLPGPFSGPDEAEAAIAAAVQDMIKDLVEKEFLFDDEVVDGRDNWAFYAVTDESVELLGIDIHRICVWHGDGDMIPFGSEGVYFHSKLAVVFDEVHDCPPGFKEKAAALFGKYLSLDEEPILAYVFP